LIHGITTILLDDGGVLNDNSIRGAEWQRLVGEFLAPRLGGEPRAWGEANDVVFRQMWQEFEVLRDARIAAGIVEYLDFFGEQRERWLNDMCARVGVRSPGDLVALAIETEDYVLQRVRCGYPGAADAVRALDKRGYRLGTSSGGSSRELEGYLGGLGVRELFPERLYGPDLVGAMKGSREFYARIFADMNVDPAETLVTDDTPTILAQAEALGARTVLVTRNPPAVYDSDVIGSLAELPSLLER
jgi:HAD superfamily hydrolase (TIGR01509 family)